MTSMQPAELPALHPCCRHCNPRSDWHQAQTGPDPHVIPCPDCTRSRAADTRKVSVPTRRMKGGPEGAGNTLDPGLDPRERAVP